MIDKTIFENWKAAYYTLGCKLNFAETSAMAKQLAENGIRKILPGETADICIINSCSVTESADKKCRQAIRKISRLHPGAYVVVSGCYAQLKPEEVSRIEGVDLVLGTKQKADILYHLTQRDNDSKTVVTPVKEICEFVPACSTDDRTRHFLKVQDGCDYFCSYCTVPLARGRSRNGKIADLVRMAEKTGNDGGKEIVLTGINIGDFGKSTGETFFDLIQALEQVKSIERFRISSIEPNLLSDDIIGFIVQSQRFAPHFHIPLQSGSDQVLRLMRRKYDIELFISKIRKIKELSPDAFIGVDLIVGVRGEKDEDFKATEQLIESLPVSQLHVFTYSERPGTQALHIDHVVHPTIKQERSKRLLELSDRKLLAFYQSQTGTTHQVLFEHTNHRNKMYGFTENYLKVEAGYDRSWINRLKQVTLSGFNKEKKMCII